jgi:hypothetical protein
VIVVQNTKNRLNKTLNQASRPSPRTHKPLATPCLPNPKTFHFSRNHQYLTRHTQQWQQHLSKNGNVTEQYILSWLSEAEAIATIHNWDDATKKSNFASRLKRPALKWHSPHSTVQPSDVRMRADQPRHSLSICGSQKDVQRMN